MLGARLALTPLPEPLEPVQNTRGPYQVAGGIMAWSLASPPSTGTRNWMSCSGTGAAMASVLYL